MGLVNGRLCENQSTNLMMKASPHVAIHVVTTTTKESSTSGSNQLAGCGMHRRSGPPDWTSSSIVSMRAPTSQSSGCLNPREMFRGHRHERLAPRFTSDRRAQAHPSTLEQESLL